MPELAGRIREHEMREVLQHNRGADHGGRPFHDLLRPGAFQAQHGESLVDVPRPFHPLQLLGNNHPVHDLRNLHETHTPFHHDHGQRRAERGHAQGRPCCACGLR